MQETQTTDIMSFFPRVGEIQNPRRSQEVVIKEIDRVFKTGTRFLILEAPVGSGKSAVAMTMALSEGKDGAHLLVPRKNLQEQYFSDFHKDISLMKGRAAYPCVFEEKPSRYIPILNAVRNGSVKAPLRGQPNCSDAPCRGDKEVYAMCTSDKECPYTLAILTAQESPIIVHNLHSFIFQTKFSAKFQKRTLMVIDEAHEIQETVRGFLAKKITLKFPLTKAEVHAIDTLPKLLAFLYQDRFVPEETDRDRALKIQDEDYVSPREEYLQKVEQVESEESFSKGFSVEWLPVYSPVNRSTQIATTLEIIPHSLGNAPEGLLFQYADKVLLMSGTIYNKEVFCRGLGIDPAEAHFIRIGSTFPKENRPIYAKTEYQVDTSHANWENNLDVMLGSISKIMSIFHDVKGLIHAPSYFAAEQVARLLNNPRVVTHDSSNFQQELDRFFESKGNQVLISPVCQQGVDFKGDRARFQIILRVPYASTGSKFAEDTVKTNFPMYNYWALVTFGQQIGRVNRSDDDYGATFLLDERFNKFLSRNRSVLPSWVNEAVIR